MATRKQKLAIEKMVENGGNASKAMKEAGYSSNTAKTPQKLTKSKGYGSVLEEYGLTKELVITALVADLKAKRGKRLPEIRLGAEMLRMTKPEKVWAEKPQIRPTYSQLFDPQTQADIREINDRIAARLRAQ